jgi:hypothetical protein
MGSKWTLGRLLGEWSGFTWLRIGTVGGLWWTRWWTSNFWRHGVSWFLPLCFRHLYTCLVPNKWRYICCPFRRFLTILQPETTHGSWLIHERFNPGNRFRSNPFDLLLH